MLLSTREEANDRLADGSGGRTIVVRVGISSHHLSEQIRREVRWRTNPARRRRGKLQIIDTSDVADADGMLGRLVGVAGGSELLRSHLLPVGRGLGISA